MRTKFYHALPYQDDSPTEDQRQRRSGAQSFFDTVNNLPNTQFEKKGRVRRDWVTCPDCGNRHPDHNQKGVDVGIAVDLVEMAYNQHSPGAFILISGDEDLRHAVSAAKDTHSLVYLGYAYNPAYDLYSAEELRTEVDAQINIADGYLEDVTR